jgi:alkyldihydroxyacetonephosphate synthase
MSRRRNPAQAARSRLPRGDALSKASGEHRIIPGEPPASDDDRVNPAAWGFVDSEFVAQPDDTVVLRGNRYELSGTELPDLLPWARRVLGVDVRPADRHRPQYPPPVAPPRVNEAFMHEMRRLLPADSISGDERVRLRHGHGHTVEEIYAVNYDHLERVPDAVLYPHTEEVVADIVDAAARHDVCLVPYGGGTNVSDALRCPEDEERMIVSVDLARLNRILWIDPVNLMAEIQAGAVGRHIVTQLAEYGLTIGHEPDSIELSTLGGWIATNASGMKKNRYGNIEDLVLDMRVVTARGELTRTGVAPRESVGIDPRRAMFGSEGTLGIITSAIVKIFPLPEVRRYDSYIFRTFTDGVAFMYDLTREARPPASVRLVDNPQFQLSQTLKPRATGTKQLKRRAEKFYVLKLRGFDPEQMCACTLVYEGTQEEVDAQDEAVRRLARRHNAMRGGPENGRRGYQLTYGIAYLRDFVMKHFIVAESLETSVPWSQTIALCEGVKRRVLEEYAKRGLPGRPFICCRVTQVYQTGVCVYFYLAFSHKGVDDPVEAFGELERCARDEILRTGGSLSHHHGVGKLRRGFLPRIMSEATLDVRAEMKQAMDPVNVFGIANQGIGSNRAVAADV